jgi:hypothetical protein
MSHGPIPPHGDWILCRPKLKGGRKYYGAYPAGFPERARIVLGATLNSPILHACGGMARHYLYPRGFGPNDKTLDMDPEVEPDFLQDARKPWPCFPRNTLWNCILIDPPYSTEDAKKYRPGETAYPKPYELLCRASEVLSVGGRVGILHYIWAKGPKTLRPIGVYPVLVGQGNRIRVFTVFERM